MGSWNKIRNWLKNQSKEMVPWIFLAGSWKPSEILLPSEKYPEININVILFIYIYIKNKVREFKGSGGVFCLLQILIIDYYRINYIDCDFVSWRRPSSDGYKSFLPRVGQTSHRLTRGQNCASQALVWLEGF